MPRHVRGSFFAEYVRMVRRRKNVDWSLLLPPEDLGYLKEHVDAKGWYPMATFERLGLGILTAAEGVSLEMVRLWGRFSARQFLGEHPELVAPDEPVESMMRLKVLRSTFFDFHAFDVPMLVDGHAHVTMTYHMGPRAEEAACHQTAGFCDEVLTLAGARDVRMTFLECAWLGDPRTLVEFEWS